MVHGCGTIYHLTSAENNSNDNWKHFSFRLTDHDGTSWLADYLQLRNTLTYLLPSNIMTHTFWRSPRSFLFCWCALWRRRVLFAGNTSTTSSPDRTERWWIWQWRQRWLDRWRTWSGFINDMSTYVQQPSNSQAASWSHCLHRNYIST